MAPPTGVKVGPPSVETFDCTVGVGIRWRRRRRWPWPEATATRRISGDGGRRRTGDRGAAAAAGRADGWRRRSYRSTFSAALAANE